jgi:hypothetical protein
VPPFGEVFASEVAGVEVVASATVVLVSAVPVVEAVLALHALIKMSMAIKLIKTTIFPFFILASLFENSSYI